MGRTRCMEIDERYLAGHGLNGLTATGHCRRRKTQIKYVSALILEASSAFEIERIREQLTGQGNF
jgi:hypothetical protein